MNRGPATPAKIRDHLRSLACRPGTTNAHSCHSQIGLASTSPATSEILSCSISAPAASGMTSFASSSRSSASLSTVSMNGFVNRSNSSW